MLSFRIDPAHNGIDIIDVENGGERVNIPIDQINILIEKLEEAYNEMEI